LAVPLPGWASISLDQSHDRRAEPDDAIVLLFKFGAGRWPPRYGLDVELKAIAVRLGLRRVVEKQVGIPEDLRLSE